MVYDKTDDVMVWNFIFFRTMTSLNHLDRACWPEFEIFWWLSRCSGKQGLYEVLIGTIAKLGYFPKEKKVCLKHMRALLCEVHFVHSAARKKKAFFPPSYHLISTSTSGSSSYASGRKHGCHIIYDVAEF